MTRLQRAEVVCKLVGEMIDGDAYDFIATLKMLKQAYRHWQDSPDYEPHVVSLKEERARIKSRGLAKRRAGRGLKPQRIRESRKRPQTKLRAK